MMAAEGTCRECGAQIPGDARTMGLCPSCLMGTVLQVRRSVIQQMDRLQSGYRPPGVAELASSFPHLEILELLACGGMGMVYKARQRSLDRLVALKVLPQDLEDEELAARFAAETRILAALNHPNIVIAHESGETPEYLFLTMELVPGPSLRAILKRGPLPPRPAVQIALQICEALAYAHQKGVIHRDIKPENVLLHPGEAPAEGGIEAFLAQGGRARLADFGLARTVARGHLDLSLTAPDRYVGTIDYVAPECREGQAASAQADLYAVGVVLYEMLTGRRPVGHFAPPSRAARPGSGVPEALDAVVMRCLAANPQERYAEATTLRDDLMRIGQPRRRPWRLFALVAVILLAGGLALYVNLSRQTPEPVVQKAEPARPADRPEDLTGATHTMDSEEAMHLMPDDVVQVWFKGQWWDATVTAREGRRSLIHYTDLRRPDEWVGPDRLRLKPGG